MSVVGNRSFAVRNIYARKGLPATHLSAVLAHEACHAFFTLKSFRKSDERKLSAALEEGTCELWASIWLEAGDRSSSPLAKALLRLMHHSPDPIYGAGYREAAAAFAEHQPAPEATSKLISFMRHLRRSKSLASLPRDGSSRRVVAPPG